MKWRIVIYVFIVIVCCISLAAASWFSGLFGSGIPNDAPNGWHVYSKWKIWFGLEPTFENRNLQDAWNAMEEYSKNVTKRYDCDVSEGYWIYKEYYASGAVDSTVFYKLIHMKHERQKRLILLSDYYPQRMRQKLFPLSYNTCNYYQFKVDKYIPRIVCSTFEEFVETANRMNKEAEMLRNPYERQYVK